MKAWSKIQDMVIRKYKNIHSLFSQSYPFYYYPKRLLKISLSVSLFIASFLFIFRPFNTDISELRYNHFVTCLIYGMISGLSFYVTIQLSIIFFRRFFNEEKWTLAKELTILIILLFVIGNANFFIRNLVNTNPDNFKTGYYLEELAHTCLVGIFPVLFFTLLNYSYLFKTNNERAVAANIIINQKEDISTSEKPSIINIKSQSVYETLSLPVQDICFIKSDGNYIEVFQYVDGEIKKHTIRNTLKDVEIQLADYANIIKTHRSYLVNIPHVDTVRGNAQGYILQIKNCDLCVPVSRNNINRFNSSLKKNLS